MCVVCAELCQRRQPYLFTGKMLSFLFSRTFVTCVSIVGIIIIIIMIHWSLVFVFLSLLCLYNDVKYTSSRLVFMFHIDILHAMYIRRYSFEKCDKLMEKLTFVSLASKKKKKRNQFRFFFSCQSGVQLKAQNRNLHHPSKFRLCLILNQTTPEFPNGFSHQTNHSSHVRNTFFFLFTSSV